MRYIFNRANLISVLLISLITKAFLVSPTVGDSVSISALSLLFGFNLYLEFSNKVEYNLNFIKELEDLEKQRDKQLEQMAELYEQRIRVVEDKLSTLNLTVTKKPLEKQSFGW